jgi:predicted peptidase
MALGTLHLQAIEDFVPRTVIDPQGFSLSYRWYRPAGTVGRLPLILYLHGAGCRGSDNRLQLTQPGACIGHYPLMQQMQPCCIVAPQCHQPKRWVDIDWSLGNCSQPPPTAEMQALVHLVTKLSTDPHIDPRRIYLLGQSMGGFGAWDLLARLPGFFAAAAIAAGGGDPAVVQRFTNVPVWTSHGNADRTVPVGATRAMVAALVAEGGQVHYREYPGRGHDIWDDFWLDPQLLPALLQCQRSPQG